MSPNEADGTDPRRPTSPDEGGEKDPKRSFGRRDLYVFLWLLFLNYLIVTLVYSASSQPRIEVPYQPTFLEQVETGNVESITAKGHTIDGTFEQAVQDPSNAEITSKDFSTEVPEFADTDELDALLLQNGVEVNAEPTQTETPLWLSLLIYVVPPLLFFGFWIWYMRKAGAAGGGMFGMGQAKAK